MKNMFNEFVYMQLCKQYENEVQELKKVCEDYKKYILDTYIEAYSCRLISMYYLKRMMNDLETKSLIPVQAQYIEILGGKETFPIPLVYFVRIKDEMIRLNIPMAINISALSRSIEKRGVGRKMFPVDVLARYISENYWADYETDLLIERCKIDGLAEEKAKNPIIVLQESDVNEYTIINGNHRVMWMHKENIQERVEVYFVTIEECLCHAVGKDWEIILRNLRKMNKWVKGSGK